MLLAARHFRYTRVAVCSPGLNLDLSRVAEGGVQWLRDTHFQYYASGEYFPPVMALPVPEFMDSPVYGSQWGIYAAQDIASNVFIGQYACDLLHGYDLILCRKKDSIMRYTNRGDPDDIFLAPRDYCGHIPLVNGGKNG